jgi:hypothetical protein
MPGGDSWVNLGVKGNAGQNQYADLSSTIDANSVRTDKMTEKRTTIARPGDTPAEVWMTKEGAALYDKYVNDGDHFVTATTGFDTSWGFNNVPGKEEGLSK